MPLSSAELLDDTHRLDVFDCGKPALNAWLTSFARTNQARGFTRVLVVHDDKAVVGYYGLAPSVLQPNSAPRAIRTGRPPDPIPCLLIGQLAVDRHYAGQGIGSGLVKDALRRCVAGADIVSGRAVVVRAIDADAERYWQSWVLSRPETIPPSSCVPCRTYVSGWPTRLSFGNLCRGRVKPSVEGEGFL